MMNFINNYNKQKSVYSRFRPSIYNDHKNNNIASIYPEQPQHYPTQIHYLLLEPIAPMCIFEEDMYNRRIRTTPKKANVTFNQTKNKTVYINGKDFYKNNNIKHNIWWSPQELAFIRNMFTIEVQRECAKYPNKSQRDCVLDLINREI